MAVSPMTGKRRKMVEALYSKGLPPRSIHPVITKKLGEVTLGTIKNDIVAIRKAWGEVLEDEKSEDIGGHAPVFFNRAMALYRLAVTRNDIRTAYTIAKDLAAMCGVEFRADLVVEDARVADLGMDALTDEVARIRGLIGGNMVPGVKGDS